jgi:hypothetical protein
MARGRGCRSGAGWLVQIDPQNMIIFPRAPLLCHRTCPAMAHPACSIPDCAKGGTERCARCKTARYCSAACQRAHWATHKPDCARIAAAAAAAASAAGGGGAGGSGSGAEESAAASAASAAAAPLPRQVYTGMDNRTEDYRCGLPAYGTLAPRPATGNFTCLCLGCSSVVYCCTDHLEEHWPAHSEACYLAICARLRSGDVHKNDAGGLLVVQRRLRRLTKAHCALDERNVGVYMSILGLFYRRLWRLDEAEPLLRECLAGRRTVFGGRHQATLASLSSLAGLLKDQGNLSEAELLMREDQAASWETLGPGPRHTLQHEQPGAAAEAAGQAGQGRAAVSEVT